MFKVRTQTPDRRAAFRLNAGQLGVPARGVWSQCPTFEEVGASWLVVMANFTGRQRVAV